MRRQLFALLAALALLLSLSAPCGAEAGRMALRYADQFSVEYEDDGTALVTVGGTDRWR